MGRGRLRKDGTPAQPCPHGPDTARDKRGRCKACCRAYQAAWRAANPEKYREKYRAASAAWYEANREKERARQAARRAANPEKVRAASAAWRAANPEKYRAASAAWRAANPEKYRASVRTPKSRFSLAQHAARTRKKEWGLSFEQYVEAAYAPCHYCKNMLDLPVETNGGLDRLDNAQGYILGNVVACCATCNRLRGDYLSPEETRVAVQAILKYRALGHADVPSAAC